MALSDRIEEALAALSRNDLENAAIQLAISVDSTAKRKYSEKLGVGARFRRFIKESEEFIYFVALGCGPRFVFEGEGGIRFAEKGSLAEVLYKYLRSPLLHEGDASTDIVFRLGPTIGMDEGRFIVTDHMLLGLLLAVVGDAENRTHRLKRDSVVTIGSVAITLNSVWGRPLDIRTRLGFRCASI